MSLRASWLLPRPRIWLQLRRSRHHRSPWGELSEVVAGVIPLWLLHWPVIPYPFSAVLMFAVPNNPGAAQVEGVAAPELPSRH